VSLGSPARAYGVALERAGRPPVEVLTGSTSPDGATREHVVDLPGKEGDRVWLSLHAGPGPDGLADVEWSAPRVTGEPSSPPSRGDDARLRDLRARLHGVSAILIVIDAARARQLSTYGYARSTTLEIDRLGREGVVFERAYTPATYTRSAMSSLWTSLYHEQHHDGVGYLDPLPTHHRTLAEILEERGVATAGFVANPAAGPSFGFDRGFSAFRLFRGRDGRVAPRAGELLEALVPHVEDLAATGRRFFTYVHFIEPHYPYDPPSRFVALFGPDAPIPAPVRRRTGWIAAVNHGQRPFPPAEQAHLVRLYDGSLAYVDREIGKLRRLLEQKGLLDRVVLVVTADHGDELYERGLIGHGSRVYEEQLRIPLVIRFPSGTGPSGLRVDEPVDLVDLAPTILDALDLGSSIDGFEGRSILPLLFGDRGREVVVGRTMHERPTYSFREGPWKLVHSVRSGRTQLYDLDADPAEVHDRAGEQPVRAEAARQSLYRWLRDLTRHPPGGDSAAGGAVSAEDREALRALGYAE